MNTINLKNLCRLWFVFLFLFCDNGKLDKAISGLYSADEAERVQAAALLVKKGDKAVPRLQLVIKSNDEIAQLLAVKILSRINTKAAAAAVIPALKNGSTDIRLEAATFLENALLPDSLESYLVAAAADSYWKIRIAILHALSRFNSSKVIKTCARHLEDTHPEVRKAAIKTLISLGGPDVTKILRTSLHSNDDQIVYVAVQTLGTYADTVSAAKILSILISTENTWIKQKAALSLAALQHTAAIPYLKKMYNSQESSRDEKVAAKKALGSFNLNL